MLCSWARHFILTVPLSNLMLGVTLLYNGIASDQGGVEIPIVASCYRKRDKLRSDGHLARSYADFLPLQCRRKSRIQSIDVRCYIVGLVIVECDIFLYALKINLGLFDVHLPLSFSSSRLLLQFTNISSAQNT